MFQILHDLPLALNVFTPVVQWLWSFSMSWNDIPNKGFSKQSNAYSLLVVMLTALYSCLGMGMV